MSDVSTRGHELLPHTADVIISAWAPTAGACIDEAVKGLVAAFAEVPSDVPARPSPFECTADSDAELLVQVLEEVIYLAEVHGVLAVGAALDHTPDTALRGELLVVPLSAAQPIGPVPKAITRHGLRFARDDDELWRCTVTVDV